MADNPLIFNALNKIANMGNDNINLPAKTNNIANTIENNKVDLLTILAIFAELVLTNQLSAK